MCKTMRYVVAPGAKGHIIKDETADVKKISNPLCVYAEEGTDAARAIKDAYNTRVVCECNAQEYYRAIQENESSPFNDLTDEQQERIKDDQKWTDEQAQLAADLAQTDVDTSHIRPFGSEKVKFWYEQTGHKQSVFNVVDEHDYRVSSISHYSGNTAVSTAPVGE